MTMQFFDEPKAHQRPNLIFSGVLVSNYEARLGFEAIIVIRSFHRSPEYLNKLRSFQFRFL